MRLEDEILQIQNGLRAGSYTNEAAVSQGIILRLLNSLGWGIFDATQVWPEYSLGSGRVDFALCSPPSKPAIIVESKDVGKAQGAERQLFEYAFHQGIPMAVLTDGQEWSFFLPGEQGAYHERCVYKLDLLARPTEESAKIFLRYLQFGEVASGRAIENAKSDYRNVSRGRQIDAALPKAWLQLLRDQDELLVELVADRVETLCGFKPEPAAVAKFIGSLTTGHVFTQEAQQPLAIAPSSQPALRPASSEFGGELDFSGFEFHGQRHTAGSAIGTLFKAFEVLSARDTTFLERFASLPKHGRKRRYLSRNKLDLYPGRPDLCEEYSECKFGGWWIGTNFSRSTIRHAIELACQVAGLRFGHDLRLI